jgi:hypothetical protein
MVEYGREIDRVVWKNAKHEIFFWEPIFMTGEGGAEFFEWQFGKRWIPAVKWVKVGKEVYDNMRKWKRYARNTGTAAGSKCWRQTWTYSITIDPHPRTCCFGYSVN